jgi:hypothetical protein
MGREVWQWAIFLSRPLKDPRPLIGLRTQKKRKRSKDERRLRNSKLGGMQQKRYDDHYKKQWMKILKTI